LRKFITDVASKLHDVSQKLFKLGQRDDKNSLMHTSGDPKINNT